MQETTVTLPYDDHAERALTRVGLLRAGVPARALALGRVGGHPHDQAEVSRVAGLEVQDLGARDLGPLVVDALHLEAHLLTDRVGARAEVELEDRRLSGVHLLLERAGGDEAEAA